MKNLHIALLIAIVVSIALLTSFLGSLSTYDTVASAKKKPGKFVHLIARLDPSYPIEYDAVRNPNYLSFMVIDSLNSRIKVVYHNAKPENLEISERLVLKGAVKDGHFECRDIMIKCPSKYNEDIKSADRNLPSKTMNWGESEAHGN